MKLTGRVVFRDIETGVWVLEGDDGTRWRVLSRGTTIGYRKLDRLAPVPVRRLRLTVEDAVDVPHPVRIGVYAGG